MKMIHCHFSTYFLQYSVHRGPTEDSAGRKSFNISKNLEDFLCGKSSQFVKIWIICFVLTAPVFEQTKLCLKMCKVHCFSRALARNVTTIIQNLNFLFVRTASSDICMYVKHHMRLLYYHERLPCVTYHVRLLY